MQKCYEKREGHCQKISVFFCWGKDKQSRPDITVTPRFFSSPSCSRVHSQLHYLEENGSGPPCRDNVDLLFVYVCVMVLRLCVSLKGVIGHALLISMRDRQREMVRLLLFIPSPLLSCWRGVVEVDVGSGV